MTEEEKKQAALAKALSSNQASQPAATLPPEQRGTATPAKDPGGFRKPQSFKEGSGQVTERVTRGAAAVLTGGLSELTTSGGKTLGQQAGQAARKIDNKVQDFLRKLDPTDTSIKRADTSGVEAAMQQVQGVGSKAAGVAQSVASRPVQAERVSGPGRMSAAQVAEAERVRGTLAGVEAGQAEAASFTPAQIQAMREAEAARIARDDAGIRDRQLALAQALEAQAAGTGPSVAEQQLRRSGEQAIAAQAALAASARGGNPILAQRQAAQQTAAIQQDLAGRAAELRLQEQAQARQALGAVLGETRGQDIGVSTEQARLLQQAELSNVEAQRQRALAQAQLEQGAAQFAATEQGATSRFNVEQGLRADLANREADLRAALADQAAVQQSQQFNAKARDEMTRFAADANLRASLANQAATLQAQGMTLDAIAKFMGLEQDSVKSILGSQTEMFKADQARLQAEKEGSKGMAGGILSTVGSVLALCFPAGEKVLLRDGTERNIEDVGPGDALWDSVVLETRQYVSSEAIYQVGSAKATGEHAVWTPDMGWTTFAKAGKLVHTAGTPRNVYTLVTSTGTMFVGGVLVGDDEHSAEELEGKAVA